MIFICLTSVLLPDSPAPVDGVSLRCIMTLSVPHSLATHTKKQKLDCSFTLLPLSGKLAVDGSRLGGRIALFRCHAVTHDGSEVVSSHCSGPFKILSASQHMAQRVRK